MRGPSRAIVSGLAVLGCVVVLAACGGASSHTVSQTSSTSPPASYSDLVGAGNALLKENNFGAAEQVFGQAIAKSPRPPVAYFDLGLAYQRAGQLFLAQRSYQHAVQADLGYVPALDNLAVMLTSRQPKLAEYYYQLLNHFRPHTPAVLLHLGVLFTKGGHGPPPSVAIKDLSEAVRLRPALFSQIPASLRRYVRRNARARH